MTPVLAQSPDDFPHALAQFHVDARGRFVEEENLRFVGQRLCDHDAPLHSAGEGQYLAVPPVDERQVRQHLLDMRRVLRLSEETPAEARRREHRLESVGGQFLRHETDH